ncbi:hypothetical protein [Actinomadura flavalba]|uniref:hypothetical protein n=1 Tax=Actinomadura flavalba TaxID=1120938 RepID=UPI00037D351E|nr:hypothetical protein [Actinomadura flavalba]
MFGDFEVHVTVAPGEAEALERWSAARGVRCAHIVLARGRAASQPMLTLRASGSLDAARAKARRASAELAADGFAVLRVKIEAAPWNDGVPAADEAAEPGRYFEHHVKLVLPPGGDPAAVAGPHHAHVSRNARRVRSDGRAERFVTQRCHGVGDATARARLAALVAALRAAGHEIAAVEREYVVDDDAESLDDGWITEGNPR